MVIQKYQIFMVHVECSSLDLCFFILLFKQQWSWSPGSNKRQNDLDRRLGWLLQPANIECSKCIGKRPVFCQTLVKRLCAVKNVSKNINQCNCQSNQHASSLSIIPMIGTAQRVAKKNDISCHLLMGKWIARSWWRGSYKTHKTLKSGRKNTICTKPNAVQVLANYYILHAK